MTYEFDNKTDLQTIQLLICFFRAGKSTVELDKDIFENRSILLKKYINDDTMELQALYALQKVYVDLEQPPSTLVM